MRGAFLCAHPPLYVHRLLPDARPSLRVRLPLHARPLRHARLLACVRPRPRCAQGLRGALEPRDAVGPREVVGFGAAPACSERTCAPGLTFLGVHPPKQVRLR